MPSDIKDLFTEEIKKIEDLRVKASETVQALNTFEDQIKKDQSRLQDIKSAITNKLEGENGKMQRLQTCSTMNGTSCTMTKMSMRKMSSLRVLPSPTLGCESP